MSSAILRPTLVMRAMFWGYYEQPGYKDRQTGEVQPNSTRIQVMVELPRENDTTKGDLIDLRAVDVKPYQAFKRGQFIEVPVGVFAPKERPGSLAWFLEKGCQPRALGGAA